ncbi:uncharacterized protein TRUGW13939_11411 [Talaromyces rugulosus]|uniref:Peptidase S1 domain-containing protein n=1 Tax=Talaromyces rugulosus TaxID=121627 RepID=A0A7H8RE09_TALRU|nr:uncharacterized protein TRUGW13939_11411 [Talaromyces rugulosus]QKX64238.1 hypothetical protein TRUGW13939_11411 [Talaromyces rugulosus]
MQISLLAVFLFILDLVQAEDSIVGGRDTTIEEHPFQLSLQHYGRSACGATILSSNMALTSAHCTDGLSASSLTVRAGSSFRGQGGQVLQVSKISQHPLYNPQTHDNDVSVLILSGRIHGAEAHPIGLQPEGAEVSVGTLGTITGWGILSSGGSQPSQLQEAEVAKISDKQCQEAYGNITSITSSMHCFEIQGKGACQGDYGGPVVIHGVQVGIISFGKGCANDDYPGVYTKISNPVI